VIGPLCQPPFNLTIPLRKIGSKPRSLPICGRSEYPGYLEGIEDEQLLITGEVGRTFTAAGPPARRRRRGRDIRASSAVRHANHERLLEQLNNRSHVHTALMEVFTQDTGSSSTSG
jgi:hypothetical protein